MVKKKERKLFSKIIVILFLLMIAIGFTIPMFNNDDLVEYAEQQPCKTDADCYLMCDSPVEVLCSRNLCQQNSCGETANYAYESIPVSFQLEVEGKEDFSLEFDPGDIYVTFSDGLVKLHNSMLTLRVVLEKLELKQTEFELFVNGEQSYQGSDYLPQEGDMVRVVY
jgi:hypothetical protein